MNNTQKTKIILAIVAISFIQGLQYCVSPVLGQIQEHYPDINVSLVQMLITAPALLSMIVALISGGLVVKISKKKLLLFAALVAGVTGFLPYLADSFWLLFISRTLYGIALGLACTLNTAVVAEFFKGDERVSVMGIQAASIGVGMVIITTLGGRLGSLGFTYSYLTNIIGFLSFLVLAAMLPDTGASKVTQTEKIRLNKRVFQVAFLGFLEFLFLITFTTNIAMHISGALAGDSSVSGILTGVFSGAQIVMGLVLGYVTKVTGNATLPVAMLSFVAGAALLILFPSNLPILLAAAVLCGFSQGMFIPQAMVDVANAVRPVATAMASACFTCAMCFGQLVSPSVLNAISRFIYGKVSTSNVYTIAGIGMAASAAAGFLIMKTPGSKSPAFHDTMEKQSLEPAKHKKVEEIQ